MNKSMLLLLVVIGVCAALPQSGEREESGRGGNRRGGGRGERGGEGRSRRGGPRLLCNIEGDLEIPQDRRPTGECPGDSTCSIGPIDVDHDGRQASISFCDAQDAQGNLLIFHGACRIELDDGSVIVRGRCGADADCCSRGPLTGFTYDGQSAEAFFPNRMPPHRRPHFGNGREQLEDVARRIDSY
ncbi:hypothetical protein CAPTEDRAFT_206688 [Capitella teleta]|uniref:Uncharacterized protein n=1 Tax=Capitella teleta TaxID=283909 RepID=R7V252_CAPTE|nr:hypothetical protein CAPTEDRAFT_194525 [Capitella teleta]ELU09766.1 hypothetical protein CAPTEDRAFT_206688 [Capitella teleta]|eukprot:ELT87856.1 hypothetical protein CAPTEDRAFT_194525 [Capitella teleta]